MNTLDNFIKLLSGHFDNAEQFEAFKQKGINNYPFAKHVNTVCNNKISHLPTDFKGIFLLEESYYTVDEKTHASPRLFLFTQEENNQIKLTSYDTPQGYDNDTFNYENLNTIDYNTLVASQKFTPAVFTYENSTWTGGSVSMFSPVLKFTLNERFSEKQLEVSEIMEMNGKRTFGYDEPIIYKRMK